MEVEEEFLEPERREKPSVWVAWLVSAGLFVGLFFLVFVLGAQGFFGSLGMCLEEDCRHFDRPTRELWSVFGLGFALAVATVSVALSQWFWRPYPHGLFRAVLIPLVGSALAYGAVSFGLLAPLDQGAPLSDRLVVSPDGTLVRGENFRSPRAPSSDAAGDADEEESLPLVPYYPGQVRSETWNRLLAVGPKHKDILRGQVAAYLRAHTGEAERIMALRALRTKEADVALSDARPWWEPRDIDALLQAVAEGMGAGEFAELGREAKWTAAWLRLRTFRPGAFASVLAEEPRVRKGMLPLLVEEWRTAHLRVRGELLLEDRMGIMKLAKAYYFPLREGEREKCGLGAESQKDSVHAGAVLEWLEERYPDMFPHGF